MTRSHHPSQGNSNGVEPHSVESAFAVGVAALGAGQPLEAEARFRSVLAQAPDHPGALGNLALIAKQRGDKGEARALLERACAQDDAPGETFYNLANLLTELDERRAALAALREAVTKTPELGRAHLKLALLLLDESGAEAARAFMEAAQAAAQHLAPNDPAFAGGLGLPKVVSRLWAESRWDIAVPLLRGMANARTASFDAQLNLANALAQTSRHHEALTGFRRALVMDPGHPDALASEASCLINVAAPREAFALFERALAAPRSRRRAISPYLMALLYSDDHDDRFVLDAHRRWCRELHDERLPPIRPRRSGSGLRIGYVTADLVRSHPVAQFIAPVFTAHARMGITQHVYLNSEEIDASAGDIPDSVTVTPVKRLDDDALARRIAVNDLDVLIDLSGHTYGNRLAAFALRPAPVTASAIGYPHSTGSSAVDWLITDRILFPDDKTALATERLACLPGSFLCFAAPPTMPSPSGDHPQGDVVFGSLNHLPKLGNATVALWASVLKAIPRARLLVKCGPLAEKAVADRLAARFAAAGVDRSRLILEGPEPFSEAMRAYERMDIALDPIPYNGGTTTAHALWMGVPVVSLAGTRSCGRMGASLLTAAGCDTWVAADTDGFVRIAAALAGDPVGLRSGRLDLHRHVAGSALCDIDTYAAALADIYRRIKADRGR